MDMSKHWHVISAHWISHFPGHGLVVLLCSNLSQQWVKIHCLLAFSNRNQWASVPARRDRTRPNFVFPVSIRCIRPVLRCPHAPPVSVAGQGACTPSDPCVLQRWQRREKAKRLQWGGKLSYLLCWATSSTVGNDGFVGPCSQHCYVFVFPPYIERVSGHLEWWGEQRCRTFFHHSPCGTAAISWQVSHKKKKSLRLQNKPNLAVPLKCPHTALFSDRPCITTGQLWTWWGTLAVQGQVLQGCPAGEFQESSPTLWSEPSRLLGIQQVPGWCFWPIF